MTSSLLAPCGRRPREAVARGNVPGSTAPTRVLDFESPAIRRLRAGEEELSRGDVPGFLRAAHALIVALIRPVYAMEDLQPASTSVRRGRGSCSQRLAVLEAVARREGVQTRVRGIVVDGAFWYQRFPRTTWAVPVRVILAWPEFLVEPGWLSVGELYGPLDQMAACSVAFSNTPGETLFDAISTTAIDWDGATGVDSCDLSAVVREDLGYFDSRDDLFAVHGQTLAWWARRVLDPVMSLHSAGS